MNGRRTDKASITEERGPTGQIDRPSVASSLVSALFLSLLLVGVVGIRPAGAAISTPTHYATISCSNPYVVSLFGLMHGFTSRNEAVAWYPTLQRYQGGRWIDLSAPSTNTWQVNAANRSFTPQPGSWSLDTIPVDPNYWYRVRSYYYWYANGYQTPAEYSSPCFVSGWVIT